MRGIPKFFNTKQDYLNVLAMPDSEVPTSKKRELLEDLLQNLVDWFPAGSLAKKEDGIEDAEHKIVASGEEGIEGETVTYTQYELRTNTGAPIFRVGFTVEEVQTLLANL